jgi:hypothetical protein
MPAQRNKFMHGEDVLDELSEITLRMDNGAEYSFSIQAETGISDDIDDIIRDQRNGPARQAFWAAMMEKSGRAMRAQEIVLATLEGQQSARCRNYLQGDREGELISEYAVSAAVSREKPVQQARERLNDLKYQFGIIRAVYNAVERRLLVLNRIVDQVLPKGG